MSTKSRQRGNSKFEYCAPRKIRSLVIPYLVSIPYIELPSGAPEPVYTACIAMVYNKKGALLPLQHLSRICVTIHSNRLVKNVGRTLIFIKIKRISVLSFKNCFIQNTTLNYNEDNMKRCSHHQLHPHGLNVLYLMTFSDDFQTINLRLQKLL